jgi:hypothetical protein
MEIRDEQFFGLLHAINVVSKTNIECTVLIQHFSAYVGSLVSNRVIPLPPVAERE